MLYVYRQTARILPILLTLSLAPRAAPAQDCDPAWHPFTSGGQIGMEDSVYDMTVWNGDLIAGGKFNSAGGQPASSIARWDGSAWHPLISGGQNGVSGHVFALTVWDGSLVAGGIFGTAGGQTVNSIARWDGTAWYPFTSGGQIGVSDCCGNLGDVYALTVWNGSLVAGGGIFQTAGGQTVNKVARWDGTAWHPFTSGGQTGVSGGIFPRVDALTVWNGDLMAGGRFTTAGGQTVNEIARWDGSAWHPFTSGGVIGVSDWVYALTEWNGDLVAGGGFTFAGGQWVNRIARWDGTAWYSFTSGGQIGVSDGVPALTVWNGDLVAGGGLTTAGGQTVNGIARWDGSAWHPFASGGQIGVNGLVNVLPVWNGDLIAGGNFSTAGGQTVNFIARWGSSASCQAFGFGDGSGTACPCGNSGAPGHGCANGTFSSGSRLSASGAPSVTGDTLTLQASLSTPGAPGLFFQGDNKVNGGSGVHFGDGLRCAGANVIRLQTLFADGSGSVSSTVSISVKGAVSTGQTKYYQWWYRDPVLSPCGEDFNTTNGLEVTWSP